MMKSFVSILLPTIGRRISQLSVVKLEENALFGSLVIIEGLAICSFVVHLILEVEAVPCTRIAVAHIEDGVSTVGSTILRRSRSKHTIVCH